MSEYFLNSEVEKSYTKINADITKILNKISETHSKNSNEIKNWCHVGDATRIAKHLEETLFLMGALDEKNFKYSK
jgi:hypothetical protein